MKTLSLLLLFVVVGCASTVTLHIEETLPNSTQTSQVNATVTTSNPFGNNTVSGALVTSPTGSIGSAQAGQDKTLLAQVVETAIAAGATAYAAHALGLGAASSVVAAGAGGTGGYLLSKPSTIPTMTTTTLVQTTSRK